MIRFLSPGWLWLLAFLPFIALWRAQPGDVAAVEGSDTRLVRATSQPTRTRSDAWLTGLTILALALLILGMARPQMGRTSVPIHSGGIDMMLLLDVSNSMRTFDFQLDGKPASRVDVVKSVIAQFIQARPNDRIGPSTFTGVPDQVSPLTLDHDPLLKNLKRVQIGAAGNGGGVGSAIAVGVNRLRDQSAASKFIVQLTDGENTGGAISPLTAAQAARALDIRVYTIGMGVRGNAPYPVDEHTLKQIAASTGAQFYRAANTEALHRVYADIDRLAKTTHTPNSSEDWQDLYGWFLIPGLLLLILSIDLQHKFWNRIPV